MVVAHFLLNQEPTGRKQKVRRDNKKRTGLCRSSLVTNGTISRFYSPLYEHWHVRLRVVTRGSGKWSTYYWQLPLPVFESGAIRSN